MVSSLRKHTRRNGGKRDLVTGTNQRSPNHIKTLLKLYRGEYRPLCEEHRQYLRSRKKQWLPYERLLDRFSKQSDTKGKLAILKQAIDHLIQHRELLHDPQVSRRIYQHILYIHDTPELAFDTLEERIAFQKRCHQVFRTLFRRPFPLMQSIWDLKQRQCAEKSVYVPRSTPRTSIVFTIINTLRREPTVALSSCIRQDDGTTTIEFTHTSTIPNSEEIVAKTHMKVHVLPPRSTPRPKRSCNRRLHPQECMREQVLSYVDLFYISTEHRGRRKCTQQFANVLRLLQRLDTDVVFLYVGSSTPMKACKCYIHAAATVGLHLVDRHASEKCENLYRLVFTKHNLQAKYAGLWRPLQNMSADGVSYLLRNYERTPEV